MVISIAVISCTFDEKKIANAHQLAESGNFQAAIAKLEMIQSGTPLYDSARIIIKEYNREIARLDSIRADSIKKVREIARVAEEKRKSKELYESLDASLDEVRNYQTKKYSSPKDVVSETLKFKDWQKLGRAARHKDQDSIKSLGEDLLRSLPSLQKRELPRMRKSYCELVERHFWEYDVDVTCGGRGYKTITFISGDFAANRTVKEFHNEIRRMLIDLRYSRAQYKWYKYDDEYTYYNLNSPEDTEGFFY